MKKQQSIIVIGALNKMIVDGMNAIKRKND